jgi:endonuclease/exonuclease/phosphatase family metal-dependent hydrolase
MIISVLQLNMNADNFWGALINFITQSNFDIIQLQEVVGKGTTIGNIKSKRDCFEELQKILSPNYLGELVINDKFTSGKDSYMGNATFYNKKFSLSQKHIVTIKNNEGLFDSSKNNYEILGRSILHLVLNANGKEISFLNTHGAWGGTIYEKPHQTEQFNKIKDYIELIKTPFVFTGDLNVSTNQPSIRQINNIARNLIDEYKITNTLNPRTHAAKNLFPKGAAVDYIFVNNDLVVRDFKVLNDDLSDHLGLSLTLDI